MKKKIMCVVMGLIGISVAMALEPGRSQTEGLQSEPSKITQEEEALSQEIQGTVTLEKPEVNSEKYIEDLNRIREDFNRKIDILQKTVDEKAKPIKEKIKILRSKAKEMKKAGNEAEYERLGGKETQAERELYQLYRWRDEQKRLLEQEKERQEKELVKKYLERYVMKEVLFIPWGSGKGEAALLDNGTWSGTCDEVWRYGPSLKVDEEGNIYIWNEEWDKSESYEVVIKRFDNPYVHKYSKIKVKKGNTYEERYKYSTSFSLKEAKKKPDLIRKFSCGYRYENFITDEEEIKKGVEPEKRGFYIIDTKTGKVVGSINYAGMENWEKTMIYSHHIFEDGFGNIYILLDNTDIRAGWDTLKVHKYNKRGELLAIIELAKEIEYLDRFVEETDRIAIDKEGNIYQLVGKEDGVHILKWKVKRE